MRDLVLAMGNSPKITWQQHQDVWELVLKYFTGVRHIKAHKDLIVFFELFTRLEKEGFYKSLDKEIKYIRAELERRADVTWRYNLKEQRFYSYEELKQKREDYKYVADEDAPWE